MLRRSLQARPAFVAAAALMALVQACAPSRPTQSAPAAPASPGPSASAPAPDRAGPMTVALLSPTGASSEDVASKGSAIVNAARLAARRGTARDIELRVYDTGGQADRAASAARRAIDEGAEIILGPLFAENTRAVGAVAAPAGVPVISFSTDSSVAGGPVYVSGFLPEAETRRILDYAARQGLTTIGVYAPRDAYGDRVRQATEAAARDTGVFVATRASYPRSFQGIEQTSGDFASAASQSGVQAILLPDGGEGLKIVASFMDYHGLAPSRVKYLGLGQWESRATLTEPALRGGWFAGADPDAVEAFASEYRGVYGATPPVISALGYDAVAIAAELAALSGPDGRGFSRADITRPQGFRGVLGPVRFDERGLAQRGLAVLEVGDGEFVVLDPAPFDFRAGT